MHQAVFYGSTSLKTFSQAILHGSGVGVGEEMIDTPSLGTKFTGETLQVLLF